MPSFSTRLAVTVTITRNFKILELSNAYLSLKEAQWCAFCVTNISITFRDYGDFKTRQLDGSSHNRGRERSTIPLGPCWFFCCVSCSSVWGPSCDCPLHSFHHNPRPNHSLLPWWEKSDSASSQLPEQPKHGTRPHKGLLERVKQDRIFTELKNWGRRLQQMSGIQFNFYLSQTKSHLSSPGTINPIRCTTARIYPSLTITQLQGLQFISKWIIIH